jgi:hypothetical protein
LDSEKVLAYFFGLELGLTAMEERGLYFSALEKMCLERARIAEKEMKVLARRSGRVGQTEEFL